MPSDAVSDAVSVSPALPRPYYEDETVTLYHGDCRELLPGLGKFDLCIADPPYGETSLDWDVWPEGWVEAVRQVTPCLWCFGSFRMFWEHRDEFSRWKLGQELIWEKGGGSGFGTDRFMRVHELAVQFYTGKWDDLRREVPRIPGVPREKGRVIKAGNPRHRGEIEGGQYLYGETRMARSVIKASNCRGYAVNETQKPEAIVFPLLSYSGPPGGRVVDCFAGSGTTLAVARRMGLRVVGIEKRESQCAEIVKRLAQGELALA